MEMSENGTGKAHLPAVLFHGIKNRFGLETCCLQSRASNMASLSVLCYSKNGTFGVIDPVRSEKTTEGGNKNASAIVGNSSGQIRYFVAVRNKP